ncbi:BA14K family protein [Rhodobacteraceae bacterium LMO-12]|nr:BA14K family protein [Rhodobacteraceae bacterium LMO-JJ12]
MSAMFNKTRSAVAFAIAFSLISSPSNATSLQALKLGSGMPVAGNSTTGGGDIIQVQSNRDDRNRDRLRSDRDRNQSRSDRERDRSRNEGNRDNPRFDNRNRDRSDNVRNRDRVRNDNHRDRDRYKRGYRGSREHRPGYRRDNDGWWYPVAAFALGAIILNQQLNNQQPSNQRSSGWSHIPARNMHAHDDWCDRKYRSYDRRSKTFQPYNGPRKYCNSPYDRL